MCARCHARECVRTPSLPENQLQRDNTTLCPWEVVKIPRQTCFRRFLPLSFSSRLTDGGIHPFVYTRRKRAEHKIRRNEIASPLPPHRPVCFFARIEGRSIDSFISQARNKAINKRREANGGVLTFETKSSVSKSNLKVSHRDRLMLFRDNRETVEFAFFFFFLRARAIFLTLHLLSSPVIRKLVVVVMVDDAALYQLGNARESRIVTGRD